VDAPVDLEALAREVRAAAICALAGMGISSTPSCRGVALITASSAASAARADPDRALGQTPQFDSYEFFWASGVFALAMPSLSPGLLVSPLTVSGALGRDVRRRKQEALVIGFATMLLLCVSPFGQEIPVIRYVSVAAALAAFGSVFFAYRQADSAI
jgi:hypothetical protein